MSVSRIESPDDPRLDPYRSLKANNPRRDDRLFIAEGSTVIRRLFESAYEITSLLISDKKWPAFHPHIPPHVPVLRVSHALACELVGFNFHQGILAAGRRRPSPDLGRLLAAESDQKLLVVAPHITDPENVGALIRIAAAFGATAVVFGAACSDPFSRRALRVSMANGLFLPIVQTNDPGAVLESMPGEFGVETFATVLDPSATPLTAVEPPRRAALVFGNETNGLSDEWADRCRYRVTIPMRGGTDSLNVAVAAGVFLYAFTRLSK